MQKGKSVVRGGEGHPESQTLLSSVSRPTYRQGHFRRHGEKLFSAVVCVGEHLWRSRTQTDRKQPSQHFQSSQKNLSSSSRVFRRLETWQRCWNSPELHWLLATHQFDHAVKWKAAFENLTQRFILSNLGFPSARHMHISWNLYKQ